jgi:hypothetical protein
MALPSGSSAKRGDSVSYNLMTSRAGSPYRAASTRASYAVTAQPVKSLANTGPALSRFALAQADSAVAMSQIERSARSAMPANLRRQEEAREKEALEREKAGRRRRRLAAWWG